MTIRQDTPALENILPAVVDAVRSAATALHSAFSYDVRPKNRMGIVSAIGACDDVSVALLQPALFAAWPTAKWADDEEGSGALPLGDWWVCDPVEGAINYIHGISGAWGVTAALVRDNVAVLSVIYLPMTDELFTAVRGCGAFLNGRKLAVSGKTDIESAIVGTGQAVPGESQEIREAIGSSITAMLGSALVVRCSVPPTLELVNVASGKMDAFWQYGQIRAGLMAGALLIEEAGGVLSDHEGNPWTLDSGAFLASAPGIYQAAAEILGRFDQASPADASGE
jgi:myo-inositol-1(or 4)-monophosphatase